MNVTQLTIEEKVDLLKLLYREVAGLGQDGDTMLAHINPEEAALLKSHGGSGTINPNTGLPEYKKAVKAVVKVVKKVAPVAALAAGAYYGFGALTAASTAGTLASSTFPTLLSTAGGIGTATSAFGGLSGIVSAAGGYGNIAQGAGLLTSVAGNVQSQKYISQSTDAMRAQTEQANLADEARNRYNQLQSRLSRYQSIRYARISQGKMEGNLGALGSGGTSSYTGSVGSVGTQTSANLGNINVAEDVGNQISGFNTAAANYGSQANTANATSGMWSDVSTLGNTALTKGKDIASIFGLA